MHEITWREEDWQIERLHGFDRNPRTITEKQFNKLKAAIKRLGYHHPVAAQPDGTIISGHQRWKALKELGHTTVRVTVPSRALTESEFREMLVEVNINNGEWDWDILANDYEAEELIDFGFNEKALPKSKTEKEDTEIEEPGTARELICPNCGHSVAEITQRPRDKK